MRFIAVCCLMLLAAACSAIDQIVVPEPRPALGFRYLELLLDDDFGDSSEWRQYAGDDVFLGLEDGAFKIDIVGRQYVWTQGEASYSDIVMEADLEQISDYDHNAFGLACRLDPSNSGRGYTFLISGDGFASIRWSDGRSLRPITEARPSQHIRLGVASNRVRALCIGDYLALWINDEFVAEARDGRASDGAVGMVGVMNYQGKRLAVAIDDLKVWRAAPDERAR